MSKNMTFIPGDMVKPSMGRLLPRGCATARHAAIGGHQRKDDICVWVFNVGEYENIGSFIWINGIYIVISVRHRELGSEFILLFGNNRLIWVYSDNFEKFQ